MSASERPTPAIAAKPISPLLPPVAPAVAVAFSGLLLALFLVVHLAGLLPALIAPARFERLAALLHRQQWLPLLELLLLAALLLHPLLALRRALLQARVRGPAPALRRSRRDGEAEVLASRLAALAPWTGGLLLLFLGVHLAQLRWSRPPVGQELALLRDVLQAPLSLLLYSAGGLAAGLHLFHGHEAAHRSLGWLDPANGARIRAVGRLLALVLAAGFALLPVLLRVLPG